MKNVSNGYKLIVVVFLLINLSSSALAKDRYYYLDDESIIKVAIDYILSNHYEISREELELGSITLKLENININEFKKKTEELTVTIIHQVPYETKRKKISGDQIMIIEKKRTYILRMNSDGEITKETFGSRSSNEIRSE